MGGNLGRGPRSPAVPDRGRHWAGGVFLLALALYAPTLGHGFVFDDDIEIVRNGLIRSLRRVPDIFISTIWAGGGLETRLYRPLTVTTYALNYALAGLMPWSYHLVNVLLHGVVSGLVVVLGRRWGLPVSAAALGGLLFAVHPVHVEVVANVVGRKDLLVTAFVLVMVLGHRVALDRGGRWLAMPVVAYAGAMLSKESGVAGLGLVWIQDAFLGGHDPGRDGSRRRRLALYAGYAAALGAFAGARWLLTGGLGIPDIHYIDNPAADAPLGVRLRTATVVLGRGLGLLFLPLTLSPDYSFQAIPLVVAPADPRFLATLVGIAALGALGVARRHRAPHLPASLGWYAVAILPAANLVVPIGTIFAERLLYLPSVAFCLVVGHALVGVRRRVGEAVAGLLIGALLVAAAAQTVRYARAWGEELTLFAEAVRAVPQSTKAHHKLGEALLAQGRAGEALEHFERALAIAPDSYRTMGALADALRELGRRDDAERWLRRAQALHPEDADILYGLGRLAREAGALTAAGDYWRRAVAANPWHAGALADLGTLSFLAGQLAPARVYWERAVQSNPRLASAWYNLGLLYERLGDPSRAQEAFRQFMRVAGPEYAAEVAQIRAARGPAP